MTFRILLSVVTLFGILGLAPALAQSRIGFVSLDRIMKDSAMAQRASKRLDSEFLKRDQEMNRSADQLKRMQENLDKNSLTMSESERTRREREFNDANREFQRKQREFREDYAARRNEEMGSIISRANTVIQQIAESDKLDIVFQSDQVVWASPRIDITEKVIKGLEAPEPKPRPADGKASK